MLYHFKWTLKGTIKLMSITEKKQAHKYREQTSGYQWRQGRGRGNIKVGDLKGANCVLLAQFV